jgi:hypothetical protein
MRINTNQKRKEVKKAKKRRDSTAGVCVEAPQKHTGVTVENRRLSGSTAQGSIENGVTASKAVEHGGRDLIARDDNGDNHDHDHDHDHQQGTTRETLNAGECRGREIGLSSHDVDLMVAGRSIPLALMRMTKSEQKALKKLPLIRVNGRGELEPAKLKKKPATLAISDASSKTELEEVDLENQTSVSA